MSERLRRATRIMVIRHAEKPTNDAPVYGVTAEGKREKECLTVRGWQRAGALAHFFAPAHRSFPHPVLTVPHFLYASKPTKREGSRRPMETLVPLAEKLDLKINTEYRKVDTAEMVDEVLSKTGVVLICWQYEFIPKIANFILGDRTTAPQEWPDDRFDLVWVFDGDSSGRYQFIQVPQCLLVGDRTTPVR